MFYFSIKSIFRFYSTYSLCDIIKYIFFILRNPYLCKLVQGHDGNFKKYIKDCGFTNQYYIETRYPADSPIIVSDYEGDECIKIAEEIYNYVMSIISNKQ
ncbi:MAG: HEPN domain-containing protein [Clostridium butyricum]|nr:HEPN domain-containing protein [Clostridium butyricum]